MFKVIDKKYKFVELFDPKTGFYYRSNIVKDGVETQEEAFMRSYPALLDVGIMGKCSNGLSGQCDVPCYQSGHTTKAENISLENYKKIVDQSKGKVFQIALGGKGDPNKHEHFEEILKYTTENSMVPNYTTSGFNLTEQEVKLTKEHCGAVAVSWYRKPQTERAIKMFLDAGCKTNIHYVVSSETIQEAINRIKNDTFPKGINAILFLLFKPVGNGKNKNDILLKHSDPRVKEFYELIDTKKLSYKVGFDSCHGAGMSNFMKNYNTSSVEPCDSGRFSAYISPDMKITPCSFDQDLKWGVDINTYSIEDAWNMLQFDMFRDTHKKGIKAACKSCDRHNVTCNPCPIINLISTNLCNKR